MSDYSEKLKDPRWQKKRLQVFKRDKWKCQNCHDRKSTLHVHHIEYRRVKNPWNYPLEDLITLCESCHDLNHEIDRHPIKLKEKTISEAMREEELRLQRRTPEEIEAEEVEAREFFRKIKEVLKEK